MESILDFPGNRHWIHGGICWQEICSEVPSYFRWKQFIHSHQFHTGKLASLPTKDKMRHKLQSSKLFFQLLINQSVHAHQVLEFNKGTLQNLYWKTDGCSSCSGTSSFVCLNKQYCAVKTTSCKGHNGQVDCSIGVQLAFSGTDKHDSVLNSWYEISNLRQYSLFGLYSNLKNSLTSQFNNIIQLPVSDS